MTTLTPEQKKTAGYIEVGLYIGLIIGALGVLGGLTGYGIELTGDGWLMNLLGL